MGREGDAIGSGSRLLAAVVLALAALAIACGAASAETMNLEPAGAIEAVSNGLVTFETEMGNISCRLVYRGELQRSFAMIEGTQFGRITSTSASECSGGVIRPLEPIYRLVYTRLLGEPLHPGGFLFGIYEINYLIEVPILFSCLYLVNGGALMRIEEEPPFAIEFRFLQATTIVRTIKLSGAFECPRSILIRGQMILTRRQFISIT